MPKKRKLTEVQKEEIERMLNSMRCSAWEITKVLKLLFNEGDDIRNKAVAMSILTDEYDTQLRNVLEEIMKYQDDD
jgi:hypothetical protein